MKVKTSVKSGYECLPGTKWCKENIEKPGSHECNSGTYWCPTAIACIPKGELCY